MAFRIPPKTQAEWVPAIEAAAAIFELAPELDPNDIKNAIEDAVRSGTLKTRDIDSSLLLVSGFSLLFNWNLEACTLCLASQSMSPLAWRWVPFVLRQDDVLALFQEPDEPTAEAAHVSQAELQSIVSEIMNNESLPEKQVRARAEIQVSSKRITETLWRSVWRKAPNKLKPGQKAPMKSDGKSDG